MVICAFGLVRPPKSPGDMLGVWISSFPSTQKKNVLSGCAAVWKIRNYACFNKKIIDDPNNKYYRLCSILNY
jgi:hypothetical protein